MADMDGILLVILLVVLGAAAGYLIKAGKKGGRCIGCPEADSCPGRKRSGC